jgi:hypothetical protein
MMNGWRIRATIGVRLLIIGVPIGYITDWWDYIILIRII